MSWTKVKIYNLALGKLLLSRETSDPDTDTSNEVKVLNKWWDSALEGTLADLDLTSLTSDLTLTLIETDPNDNWSYSYEYPTNCIFFRRIKSAAQKDNRSSRIPLKIFIDNGRRVIYSNEQNAVAEIIADDLPLTALTSDTAEAIACKLATMAAPLIVGKGAKSLKKSLMEEYKLYKGEAQERDHRENFNFDDPSTDSEFVEERLS